LAASALSLQAQNVLQNGGFEAGATESGAPFFWGAFSETTNGLQGAVSTAAFHSGANSMEINNRATLGGAFQGLAGPQNPNFTTYMDVQAGWNLSFSGWVLNDGTDPLTGSSFGRLQIEFYNSSGAVVDFANWGRSSDWTSTLSTSTWTQFSTSALVPVGATRASFVVLNETAGQNTGAFFVDDLVAIPEPSSMAMLAIGGIMLVGLTVRRFKK
jgi:hypothetical protein